MAQPVEHATQSGVGTTSNYQGWDRALTRFLKSAGLLHALNGFECDILVMNMDTEKEDIPLALEHLHHDLLRISKNEELSPEMEERKLKYIHLANDLTPVSHTQLNRSISSFIAHNRARNNVSNRNEFLKKRLVADVSPEEVALGSSSIEVEPPTCARTDAVPVNRDVQMKYDVAKNEGGPLRRTVKTEQLDENTRNKPGLEKGKGKASAVGDDNIPTLQQHPGLGERFTNLEDHLAVRYVPSPPASLLDRVRFLEDHIVRLERDYPPWAALHFNQPKRGWPPPPRATPLIVPSHLTSAFEPPLEEHEEIRGLGPKNPTSIWPEDRSRPGGSRGSITKPRGKMKSSSLHRAVMQKLEVKKALAGD